MTLDEADLTPEQRERFLMARDTAAGILPHFAGMDMVQCADTLATVICTLAMNAPGTDEDRMEWVSLIAFAIRRSIATGRTVAMQPPTQN